MEKQVIQDLLGKIYLECQKQLAGIDAKRFRAHNDEHWETLDQMEKGRYIDRMDDTYFVRLGALPFIQDTDSQVVTMIKHCDEIIGILKKVYKDDQDQEISINTILKLTEISIKDTAASKYGVSKKMLQWRINVTGVKKIASY